MVLFFASYFLFYLIIVTVWILTADEVAQESCQEELATQYHRDEGDEEVG